MWKPVALIAAAGVSLAWFSACVRYLVLPTTDPVRRTEAVLVLASPGGIAALNFHAKTMDAGANLVFSVTPDMMQLPEYQHLCAKHGITCFAPEPSTTAGEAIGFSRIAGERGWRSVTVITHRSHISRTRMLMKRHFTGEVRMSVMDAQFDPQTWIYAFAYETGAFIKAALIRTKM